MAEETKLTEEQINEGMFMSLVLSLNTAAMCQLGKMADPFTGKQERDLARAKGSIDMLRMLKAKTAGNLAEKESQLLEQSITNLQMNYLEEMKKGAQAADEGGKKEAAAPVEAPKADAPAKSEEKGTPEKKADAPRDGAKKEKPKPEKKAGDKPKISSKKEAPAKKDSEKKKAVKKPKE